MSKELREMTKVELIARYKLGNPFAEKAASARFQYEKLIQPTAHEKSMESYFPLGGGYGRKGGEKRIEASVNRAVRASELLSIAKHREEQAETFDVGIINFQGRRMNDAAKKRSNKNLEYKQSREERISEAKRIKGDKPIWAVPVKYWAESFGYFSGSARELVEYDHREAVEKALSEGKHVPYEVLVDYPDLNKLPSGIIDKKNDKVFKQTRALVVYKPQSQHSEVSSSR